MNSVQCNATWAHVFAGGLARPLVISPGSRSTPLVLAMAGRPQADVHCILDERAAGFFALGLARASGQAVVLLCTSGSAAAHYLPAVIEAHASAVPLVIVTADRPPELHHCGAPQTIDQQRLFGAHVRWFVDVGTPQPDTSPQHLRTVLAQALDHAEGARPGPVHINVPMREPLWAEGVSDAASVTYPPAAILRGPPRLTTAQLDTLAAQLSDAPRGVVVAGTRAPNQDDLLAEQVGALAQRLGWPVLAEPTSQLRRDAEPLGQHLIHTYDALLRSAPFATRHAPEVVLRIGQTPTSKVLNQWLQKYATGKTVLVDPFARWFDPGHGATCLAVAEPSQLLAELLHRLKERAHSTWLEGWKDANRRAAAALERACAEPFWEGAIARTVAAMLPPNAALHVASSMPIRDLDSFASPTQAAVFTNRGANGIDGTLACAHGTAHGWASGPTVVLLGDLAFLHDVGALQLARQRCQPLTVVVVNNCGGGIFDFLPIAGHGTDFERYFPTPQNANIGALTQAVQGTAVQVRSIAALRAALGTSFGNKGLTVIEALVDEPRENVRRHQAAWKAVHLALETPDCTA